MIVRVLCEDTAWKAPFEAEHGLSLLIKTTKHLILFDAGQSDLFIRNANRLGVNLEDVDLMILSHGHYDHGGGLETFLAKNTTAPVFLRKEAFGAFYHGNRYIGLHPALLKYRDRFHFLSQETQLDEEVTILPAAALPKGKPSALSERKSDDLLPDIFEHEQYLLISEGEIHALFTGCAHRGIDLIAKEAVRRGATYLVGGFHLQDKNDLTDLQNVADTLSSLPLAYYTGHCTGHEPYKFLKTTIGCRLHSLSAGMQFIIGSPSEKACFLFRQGYNCSQSVLGAFAETLGMDFETAMRISCSFGGGIGRLREVCGAVSGMLMVCGMKAGYAEPETGTVKATHYRLVQELANEFRRQNGSIICRELLGGTASDAPEPTVRTPEFYNNRPCERLIETAARMAENKLFKKE